MAAVLISVIVQGVLESQDLTLLFTGRGSLNTGKRDNDIAAAKLNTFTSSRNDYPQWDDKII